MLDIRSAVTQLIEKCSDFPDKTDNIQDLFSNIENCLEPCGEFAKKHKWCKPFENICALCKNLKSNLVLVDLKTVQSLFDKLIKQSDASDTLNDNSVNVIPDDLRSLETSISNLKKDISAMLGKSKWHNFRFKGWSILGKRGELLKSLDKLISTSAEVLGNLVKDIGTLRPNALCVLDMYSKKYEQLKADKNTVLCEYHDKNKEQSQISAEARCDLPFSFGIADITNMQLRLQMMQNAGIKFRAAVKKYQDTHKGFSDWFENVKTLTANKSVQELKLFTTEELQRIDDMEKEISEMTNEVNELLRS